MINQRKRAILKMKLFTNGKIYLERDQFAEAMLIKDNIIVKIGSEEELENESTSDEIIDLNGKTVLPGFIDSHLHFLMTAQYLSMLNITNVPSMAELLNRIERHIKENNLTEEDILYTEGWNQNQFSDEKRVPNRHDIDKVSKDVPVILIRVDRHMASLNTAALNYFKITKDTKLKLGGEILKDENGELTGVLTEGALDLIRNHLPEKSLSEKKDMLIQTMKKANEVGITSAHTNDAKDEKIDDTLKLYQDLEDEKKLTVRFYQQIWFNDGINMPTFFNSDHAFQKGTDWNKIGPIKLFIDGSLGARTAALREPYSDDPTSRGILTKSEETLTNEVTQAVENGYQVIIHGIGDRGIETILNAYDKALNGKENTLRLGINHMQITDHHLIDRVADKGYLTYVQPLFLEDDLPILYERVGSNRAKTSYLFQTMINKNIHQSFSSDAPVVSYNPFEAIQSALTRNRISEPLKQPHLPEEAMDIYSAIDAHTIEGAYASFDEDKKGRLKEGYLADFIILNEDIFTTPKEKIKDITVLATYVDGKNVYQE